MEDELVRADDKPKVNVLIEAFKGCTPWGDGNWNRVADNENVRFTRWPGQTADGKKHDSSERAAFPFDGASDTRIPLADAVVNENVAVCCASFWRALIRPKGSMSEEGSYAVKLADYFVNTLLYHDLVREVELSEQYRSTLGWVALHPTWSREILLGRKTVTMEQIVAAAGQSQPGDLASALPLMIADPTLDSQSAEVLQNAFLAYARQEVAAIVDVELPPLRQSTLMKAVKELRETGTTDLPVPYVAKNQPEIVALKPWDEIFVPNSCTDIQRTPMIFRRVWMTEVEMRSRILTHGWKQDWVEEALKHKGEYSTWTSGSGPTSPPVTLASAMNTGSTYLTVENQTDDCLVEVIYAVYRQLDEDNVPGVYYTVFHTAVADVYAEHGLLDAPRGEYPFVTGQRENWSRNITQSRGVPQVAQNWQREIKVQRDGLVDHTSLGVTPPLLVPKGAFGTRFKFAPAAQNEITPGREPKFLQVPQSGTPLAMQLMEIVERDLDNYFGRMSPEVPPARVQVKQQQLSQPFLLMWSKALQMTLSLAQRYMPDAEFSKVTGAPPGWLEARRSALGTLDVELHFDARELDPELVMAQLEAINKVVLPGDVGGVIDRSKLTKLQLRAINPALGRELVADQGEASQRIFQQVKNDIALMFLGNEPEYVEMDPTAQTKLGFASQIVAANPNYVQALQQGGRFKDLMEKWTLNLQFSITQEQNKQVGAIGVRPEAMEQQ